MEQAVLIDSATALYAMGGPSTHRDACRAFIAGTTRGRGRAYASVEMIQEFGFHRLRVTGDRTRAAQETRGLAASFTLLPFDREVLDLSLELIERMPTVRGRDAVHAATALAYGIPVIASTDRGFDGIPGLIRIDPLTAPTESV